MDHKLKGFAMGDAVLTGVETRSSSPVRLERGKEDLQSLSAVSYTHLPYDVYITHPDEVADMEENITEIYSPIMKR